MKTETYFRRFIFGFFFGKLSLISFLLLLGYTGGYTDIQVRDMLYIIAPTFAASFGVFLNFLRSIRQKESIPSSTSVSAPARVSKTEVSLVFSGLIFYLLFSYLQISSLQIEDTAFIGLKLKIAFVETMMGGFLGWVILDINNHIK